MKLSVRVAGRELLLELSPEGNTWRFRVDGGPERAANAVEPEPGLYSVLLDGRSYEARVEPGASGAIVVVIGGDRFEVEVRDPRRLRRGHGWGGPEGLQTLTAPMPGKVVKVLAEAGSSVAAGQPLLVVEAMKMQNEMRAPKAGTLVSLTAREGGTVAPGDVLAVIE